MKIDWRAKKVSCNNLQSEDYLLIEMVFRIIFNLQKLGHMLSRSESQKFSEDLPPVVSLSRTESVCSILPFKVHLTKREPDREIRELFCSASQQDDSLGHDCDAKSSSTAEELTPSKDGKLTLVDLAIRMIEEHKLKVSDFGPLTGLDRMFLSNIIYIKNNTAVDPELETSEFVTAVNSQLVLLKEKRNDDRLRFIYKRAIKHLLSQCSSYTANKLNRMQDFEQALVQRYFPESPELAKELMDTSFASKKKLQKLFGTSPQFKSDFLGFAKTHIRKYYLKYTQETYSNMFKQLQSMTSRKDGVNPESLFKSFKRLPWRAADVESTVEQICNIVKE